MILRPYQTSAVNAVYKYFEAFNGNCLLKLPTGTGKSVVIARLAQRMIHDFPDTRILIGTHVMELIQQNHEKFHTLWHFGPSGIFSAGLKSRNTQAQVLFFGIQSAFRHAFKIQRCDILIIDECHLLSNNSQTMWRSFISDLLTINPHMKVIGLTATDFRMDSGSLTYGDNRIFTDIAYEYPILEAFEDGYLCPVVTIPGTTEFDVSLVSKRGGEYIPGQLEKVYNVDAKTEAAVKEIIANGQARKSWLIFAAGNAHAESVGSCLQAHGINCKVLTEKTSDDERKKMIADLKSGAIKAIVNNMILTTGFDAPNIDLIAVLRSTGSPGLWMQILGRGFRPIYAPGYDLDTREGRIGAIASGPKPDCLVLDFGGNAERHGPIDKIKAKNKDGSGTGDPVVKACPKCFAVCFAGVRECQDCGFKFPEPELKIATKASTAPLLSTQIEPEWIDVDSIAYVKHSKEGKPDSLRVDYYHGLRRVSEWVAMWHGGGATKAAERWWRRRALYDVEAHGYPENVDQAIEAAELLRKPVKIGVIKEGKFERINNYNFNVDSKVT